MPTVNGKRIDEFTPLHAARARNAAADWLCRRVTQTEFAKMLGYSRNTVACWENGTRNPDPGIKAILMMIVESPSFIGNVLKFTGGFDAQATRDRHTIGSSSGSEGTEPGGRSGDGTGGGL